MRTHLLVAASIVFLAAGSSFARAQTPSATSIQSQIEALLKLVESLQAQVEAFKGELGVQAPLPALPEAVFPPALTRTLARGDRGDDVSELQRFLAQDPEIYPEAFVTGSLARSPNPRSNAGRPSRGLSQ